MIIGFLFTAGATGPGSDTPDGKLLMVLAVWLPAAGDGLRAEPVAIVDLAFPAGRGGDAAEGADQGQEQA